MHSYQGEKIDWAPYTSTRRGSHLPWRPVRLNYQGQTLDQPLDFIVDTGAARTVAPMHYANSLIDLNGYPLEEAAGMKDAQGNKLQGVPIPLELELKRAGSPERIRFEETVWFCLKVRHGLLGQTSVFEQLGAIFCNFEPAREFGLFRRPGSFETLSFHTPGAWEQSSPESFEFTEHDIRHSQGRPGLLGYTFTGLTHFKLQVDWRAQAPGDTSRILLQLPSAGLVLQKTDWAAGIEIPLDAHSLPLGEWHTFDIEVRESHLRVTHQGVERLSTGVPPRVPGNGRLVLQNHPGSHIQFRAPRLRRL